MNNKLICPFCQQELVREGSDNYWCKKCNLERYSPALYGSQKLWQELIRTRKALEIAVDALKGIKDECYDTTDVLLYANKALEQITALEQRD